MPTPANQELYDKVKKYADKIYSKPRIININTLRYLCLYTKS